MSTRRAHRCRFRYGQYSILKKTPLPFKKRRASILFWSLAPFDLGKFCFYPRNLELTANQLSWFKHELTLALSLSPLGEKRGAARLPSTLNNRILSVAFSPLRDWMEAWNRYLFWPVYCRRCKNPKMAFLHVLFKMATSKPTVSFSFFCNLLSIGEIGWGILF